MKVELDHTDIVSLIHSLEVNNIVLEANHHKELIEKLNNLLPKALDEYADVIDFDTSDYIELNKELEDNHLDLKIQLENRNRQYEILRGIKKLLIK